MTSSDLPTLRRRVERIDWWHTMDLGNGIVTRGSSKSAETLRKLGMPTNLRGKRVIDVGAWDGFFSFEAERRGADRVLATDSFAWRNTRTGKAGFELAREVLGSAVEDREIDVHDLSPATVGTFDLVLFLGVLYHMRNPILALERIASICSEQLILATMVDMTFTRRPAAAFYPFGEMKGDPTNWWGPNVPAVVGMLRASGFERVKVIQPRRFAARAGRILFNGASIAHSRLVPSRTTLPVSYLANDRLVVHAWKSARGEAAGLRTRSSEVGLKPSAPRE